jgi:signal transduction histidine kinase
MPPVSRHRRRRAPGDRQHLVTTEPSSGGPSSSRTTRRSSRLTTTARIRAGTVSPVATTSGALLGSAGRSPARFAFVRWFQRHPYVTDAAMALALLVVALGNLVSSGRHPTSTMRGPDAIAVLLLIAIDAPLVWRRRAPIQVLAVVLAGTMAYAALGYTHDTTELGLLLAVYTVASSYPHRTSLRALLICIVAMSAAALVGIQQTGVSDGFANVAFTLVYVLPWVLGENTYHRRRHLVETEERAERAEQERERETRQAVTDERTRIARELHDVVAHAMSVMVVQAGAGRRVLAEHPDKTAEALANIELTGRDGLAEMRRLLGVLRQDDPATDGRNGAPQLAPQPGLSGIDDLAERWQQAGLPVTVEVEGTSRPLPTGADLSAYRIIQEALTNAFKHAGAAHVTVRLTFDDAGLQIDVIDDGRGASVPLDDSGGHGLIGMRERVAIFGGSVQAGPRPGGGFAVQARLPLASDLATS